MKVKNLNSSSFKTKSLIKETFIQMLAEKKELSKISVTELVQKANINRSTFYSHYDDIYCVAEEYENDIIDTFYNTWEKVNSNNFEYFLDSFFGFIEENDHKFKMLCTSNEVFFSIARLNELFKKKLIERYNESQDLNSNKDISIEITIFTDGMLYEYIKYCRDYNEFNISDLHNYAKKWYQEFHKKHSIRG